MIYVDTSVILAGLFAEDTFPPDSFWEKPLVSSRLIQYEVWARIHARRLSGRYGEAARSLLGRIAILELSSTVLTRALEPFPTPVRTLDALHLASAHFLQERETSLRLATYDQKLARAARKLGISTIAPK